MSTIYSTSVVIILATILPQFGIKVSTEELTNLIQAIVVVAGGLFIMYKRYKMGGVTVVGTRIY